MSCCWLFWFRDCLYHRVPFATVGTAAHEAWRRPSTGLTDPLCARFGHKSPVAEASAGRNRRYSTRTFVLTQGRRAWDIRSEIHLLGVAEEMLTTHSELQDPAGRVPPGPCLAGGLDRSRYYGGRPQRRGLRARRAVCRCPHVLLTCYESVLTVRGVFAARFKVTDSLLPARGSPRGMPAAGSNSQGSQSRRQSSPLTRGPPSLSGAPALLLPPSDTRGCGEILQAEHRV